MEISFEQFAALDMRVGTILSVQIPKGLRKPAYLLQIDFGPLGIKKSSAQLTQNYDAESLPGRQVVAAVNLGSRQIGSYVSECLVLAAVDDQSGTRLLMPDVNVANGTRIS